MTTTCKPLLPTSEDDLMVREILGEQDESLKKLGLLRLLAHESRWVSSRHIAEIVGVFDDVRKTGRLRSVLFYARRLGLIDTKMIEKNFAIYKISQAGMDELLAANEILDEYGWGYHPDSVESEVAHPATDESLPAEETKPEVERTEDVGNEEI